MTYKPFTARNAATIAALCDEMRDNAALWADCEGRPAMIEAAATSWNKAGADYPAAAYIKALRAALRETRRPVSDVFKAIRALGFTCHKTDGGDYRLAKPSPFGNGRLSQERRARIEAAAYYSDDLGDVLASAIAWAARIEGVNKAAAAIEAAPAQRGGAGIEAQTGPFMHMQGATRRRVVKGQTYIVGIAGAYNAGGLIGPEHNGLFVLNETRRAVVTDRICEAQSGYYGPTQKQWDALRAFMTCSDNAFLSEIMASPRYRGAI